MKIAHPFLVLPLLLATVSGCEREMATLASRQKAEHAAPEREWIPPTPVFEPPATCGPEDGVCELFPHERQAPETDWGDDSLSLARVPAEDKLALKEAGTLWELGPAVLPPTFDVDVQHSLRRDVLAVQANLSQQLPAMDAELADSPDDVREAARAALKMQAYSAVTR